jgi:hypothetical protein
LDHSQSGVIGSNGAAAKAAVFENWKDWPPSNISHHGRLCCDIAREWITATDYSSLNGGNILSGPRWLRHRFEWGPSTYPVHWCEAVRRKTLDCGALAALAHETFTIRGVKSYRVQLVQRFSRSTTDHWSNSWHLGDASKLWINNDVIYHEGCAVAIGANEIKVWDASAGWWIDPKPGDGYGTLLAIRVCASPRLLDLAWGTHSITPSTWQTVN